MSDPDFHDPKDGCTLSASGLPGVCIDTAVILPYSKTLSQNYTLNVETYYDHEPTVKYYLVENRPQFTTSTSP